MKAIYIFFMSLLMTGCGTKAAQETETCKVKNGVFYVDLVEEGEIQATNAINISSPAISWRFGMLKITQIVEDGDKVNVGDTVILFDPSEVQKAILDAEAELEIAKAELQKMRAEHSSKIEELKANIQISDISHQISEIKLEQATFESDITRKEIRLNLDKAAIALDKAREEIVNQEKIHHEEIQQSVLKIRQLKTNLSEAHLTLEKLIDLPDLDELKVEAEISEVDIAKISLGLETEIKLDAFSDTVYAGKVISIANLAQFKDEDSKIKVFPVEVLIDGNSAVFLPGMTVSCRIIVDKIENVLYIPLEALIIEENKHYVYVRSGSSYIRKQIVTKQKNNDYIIVEEGLRKDELIAMSDPFPDEEDKQYQK